MMHAIRRLLVIGYLAATSTMMSAAQNLEGRPASTPSVDFGQHSPPNRLGIGVQVGDPSGISVKVYRRQAVRRGILGGTDAYSVLAAWNLNRFFYVATHALRENGLEDSPLNYYIGPGLIAGFREFGADDTDLVLGISAEGGINFFTERFEVFLGLTPWFRIIPNQGLYLGGGVGLRFYP